MQCFIDMLRGLGNEQRGALQASELAFTHGWASRKCMTEPRGDAWVYLIGLPDNVH